MMRGRIRMWRKEKDTEEKFLYSDQFSKQTLFLQNVTYNYSNKNCNKLNNDNIVNGGSGGLQ